MASFRDWLAAGETIREVYEGALRSLVIEDALSRLIEFYNAAVGGDLRLVEDSDDDGPVELDDPFAGGDENAKPVEVTPDDPEPEPEAKRKKAPSASKASNVEVARTIQQMAWRIRWGSMLERAGLVERVRRIYEDEWIPLMKEREGQVKEEIRRELSNGTPEEELRRMASERLGITILEASRLIARFGNEWAVISEEDDWGDVPDFGSEESDFDERAKEIMNKAQPILVKLGYLDRGELDRGKVRDLIGPATRAMAAASNETGNEPPDNETTREIRKNPSLVADAQNRLWQAMYDKFMGLAKASYKKLSREMPGGEDGERRIGSQYFQDATEILSDVVTKLIGSLSERKVNQDLSAPAWDSNVAFMTADPEKDADSIIGSLGIRFRPQNVIRDVVRQDNKASAQAPSSTQRAQRLSQGATGDDGVQTSIDPEDTRTRDSLTNAATAESAGSLVEAFKQAMKDLRRENPTHSMLACLWFSLECSPDGTPAETKVAELMSAAGGATMSSRITPNQFLDRLGRQGLVSGQDRGAGGAGGWKLVELVVKKDLPRTGKTLGLRPMGNMPENPPNYTMVRNNPGSITPEQMKWWNFYNTVNDAKNKAIEFITKRMNEIMIEQSDELSTGQKDAHSWSLPKFLETAYMDQVRTGHAVVDSRTDNDATIRFYGSDKRNVTRSFRLTADRDKVSVVQEHPAGFEGNVFRFSLPETTPGQPMDSRGLMRMEWKIKERLNKTQRKK